MAFPRMSAAIFVFLLVGSLALVCVGGVAFLGPTLAHGNNVEHADGKIIALGPGMNFVLKTASGQNLHLQCGNQCRASLGHLERHLHEHAHTDVYYMVGPNNSLLVMDVD